VQEIRDEGAQVTQVDGSHDGAVSAAALRAKNIDGVSVQATSREGYEEVPRRIVEGYATLFAEADQQLAATGVANPGLVIVPAGVGSLLQAALAHYRRDRARPGAAMASVEPEAAVCVTPSLIAAGAGLHRQRSGCRDRSL
jgi:diaminopropionate ammonia-lyase